MKVAGVITEYNPFHNGHKYKLEQIKRQTSADYIVVVMSGDWSSDVCSSDLKNHLATIRSWAKREKPKYNPADYTFEEGDSL